MNVFHKLGYEFGRGLCDALLECRPRPHHDPIVSLHQGIPTFAIGDIQLSQALNLPFDEIATVALFATRASGQKTSFPIGGTITSDNPAVVVTLSADSQSYTAAATALTGSANVTAANADGSITDVAVVNIVDDAVVSVGQDTANATFSPNPTPPTA